jgi:hypothetical protein
MGGTQTDKQHGDRISLRFFEGKESRLKILPNELWERDRGLNGALGLMLSSDYF